MDSQVAGIIGTLFLVALLLAGPIAFFSEGIIHWARVQYAKKNQYKFFNNLKKGDVIWSLRDYDNCLSWDIVKEIWYSYKRNNTVDEIHIQLEDWNTISIPPHTAKTTRYMNYFTNYTEVKTLHDLVEKQRNASLESISDITEGDVAKDRQRAVEQLTRKGNETIERIKIL